MQIVPCATGGVVQVPGTEAPALNEIPGLQGAVGFSSGRQHHTNMQFMQQMQTRKGDAHGGMGYHMATRDGLPLVLVQPEKPNEPPSMSHVRALAVPV